MRYANKLFFEIYYQNGWFKSSSVAAESMDARDRYVAKRIQDTLVEGGTAILFMGAMHDPIKYITDKDIEIVQLSRVIVEAYRIKNEYAGKKI